jgi:hypothetical protein
VGVVKFAMADHEYYIEFQQVGTLVKVTAIDSVTGREAIIQGPASAGEAALSKLAVQKLEYLLRKGNVDKGA